MNENTTEGPYLVHDGIVGSPCLIFLRAAGRFTDQGLLEYFGFSNYVPSDLAPMLGEYLLIASDNEWIMLADSWSYTLGNSESAYRLAADLGLSGIEVFLCSVGDTDRSFDFAYYLHGIMVRKYVVIDPDYKKPPKVVENTGVPLPGEAEAFLEKDEMRLVQSIARSLGIKTDYRRDELRVFVPRK